MSADALNWSDDPLPTPSTPSATERRARLGRRPRFYTRRAEIVDERPGVYGVTLEPLTFKVLQAWPTMWVGSLIAERRVEGITGLSKRKLAGRIRHLRDLGLIEFRE